MNADQIRYALAKKLPDMIQRGMRIETTYGEIDIAPGWLAERIARQVRFGLQLELEQLSPTDATQPLKWPEGLEDGDVIDLRTDATQPLNWPAADCFDKRVQA